VQEVVKSCAKLRALGSRHSFNGIADSSANQISLMHLDQMTLDREGRTVTIGAGVTYGGLSPYLDSNGFALHNLASLPHISVAGARATATHGSGIRNKNLATAVSVMEIVTADGNVVNLSRQRDGERFLGAVVDLGAVGVITSLTLDIQPTFEASQVVYENLSMGVLEESLEDVFSGGYSVSLFTDWQGHRCCQAWVKTRVEPGATPEINPEFFGAKLAAENLHPAGGPPENCTEQGGIPGPWHERLPHFRMGFTPSCGEELQSEYFVPLERGYEAILAMEQLRDQITPLLIISELRTIDADSLWMSPCYKRPSMAIHFTWQPDWPKVKAVLPLIEATLAPFDARPHWGKLFTIPHSRLRALYEKLPDFQALLNEYDPSGKFRNDYLQETIFG
jgi:xylitol oxidase